ncbi:MAG: hypothetical protein WC742_00365 [Gallionellaceae bacterium]|jgi:MSHA biogenesis protein MshP
MKISNWKNNAFQHHPIERGVSLVTAIFLLVVIGGLGMFAVTLSTTQSQSTGMDILGKRAYQAARAGIEWGAFHIVQSNVVASPNGVGGFASSCLAATAISSVTLSAPALEQFTVQVSCSNGGQFIDAVPVQVYMLSASAVYGGLPGNPDYVERQISVTLAL